MNLRSSNRSKGIESMISNKSLKHDRMNEKGSGSVIGSEDGRKECDGAVMAEGDEKGSKSTDLRQEIGTQAVSNGDINHVLSGIGITTSDKSINPNISDSCHVEKDIRGLTSILDVNSKTSMTKNFNVHTTDT